MAVTRLGIDGGIAPEWSGFTGTDKPTLTTRMGISGGITRYDRNFAGKSQSVTDQADQALETNTAFPVVDGSVVQGGLAQTDETNQALPVSVSGPATITSVNSSRGVDIATANETIQVNVSNSAGITSVTVNGVACSLVQIINATEVNAVCPLGFNIAYGSAVDVVVDNGDPSPAYSVTAEPPFGFVETDFTVDYAGLNVNSPFEGDTTFQDLVIGDSCVYESTTTPGGNSVTMSGDGEFTIGGTISAQQTFDYYIWDASDNTPSPTIETITVQPGPVEALIGQASETDTAGVATGTIAVSAAIGQASEADSTFAVTDGSLLSSEIGQTTEADSALPVAGGPQQVISIGQVSTTSEAFAVVDASVPTETIGQAVEVNEAQPVIDITKVNFLIGFASETNTALDVDFPATLDSLRDQNEAIQASLDALTADCAALQALVQELYRRFDLDETDPNTYANDASSITNNTYTLTKTDNGDGTFTINKT